VAARWRITVNAGDLVRPHWRHDVLLSIKSIEPWAFGTFDEVAFPTFICGGPPVRHIPSALCEVVGGEPPPCWATALPEAYGRVYRFRLEDLESISGLLAIATA
jgi:hypothetical protein